MGQGLEWKLRTTILLFMFRYLSVRAALPARALGLFTRLSLEFRTELASLVGSGCME